MSDENKCCLNCKIHWDREGGCEVCRWEDENNPSLFYRITRSPETLAEKLVYITVTAWGKTVFISTIIRNEMFRSREEAITATVARLKEMAE